MFLNILITILLVLLNGFFVAAEFAIVKVRASQIELRAQAGNKLAKMTLNMINNLDAYLSATQLGITLASLGLGWVGESVVSEIILNTMHLIGFNDIMKNFGFSGTEALAHTIAVPIAFSIITVMHIVFGELAPKSLAIQRPESTSLALSIPLQVFYFVFKPVIWLMNGFSNLILRALGITPMHGSEVHSSEELRLIFEQSKESGAIQDSQHELISNVFSFNDRMVKQIMVPRTKLCALDIEDSEDKILDLVFSEGYSRIPVYKDTIDNIVGILYVKDLLLVSRRNEKIVLSNLIRPPYFVPETKKINRLLQHFQRSHMHMAIVSDEFGGVSGIVTIEDIMEELVGEIQDEYDEEVPVVEKTGDFEFRVSADASILDVNDFLPYPLPEGEDYETVGGLINVIYGSIPEIDETAVFNEYEFKVLEKSQRNIDSVLLTVTEDKRDDVL